MTTAEAEFHRIAASIPDATEGKMFGKLCIKAPNGKAGVAFFQDEMVFKLPADLVDEALGLDGATGFDPSGKGRPMKGWVQLPARHSARWESYAREAMAFVASL